MSKFAQHPPEGTQQPGALMVALTEILWLAVSTLAGTMVAWVLGAFMPRDQTWSGLLLGSTLIGGAGLAYLGFEHFARGDEDVRPLVPDHDRKPIGTCLLIVLGGFVAAFTGSGLLGLLQEKLFSIEVTEQDAILKLVEEGDSFELALLTISAVVLAPMCEELLFRHMFFRRLWHGAGPTLAWVLPAIAFSLYHFNLPGLAIYAWLGLVFAAAYLFSGRLWVAMAVHGTYNAAGVALLLWMPELS